MNSPHSIPGCGNGALGGLPMGMYTGQEIAQ